MPLRVRDAILNAREPGTLALQRTSDGLASLTVPCLENSRRREEARVHGNSRSFEDRSGRTSDGFPRLETECERRSLIRSSIRTVFDQTFRDSLAERAENLLVSLRDLDLKAFCLRVLDKTLPEPDWLESVGSLLASTPPSRWKDETRLFLTKDFKNGRAKFLRVESVAFRSASTKIGWIALFRVALTARDGQERDQVVHLRQPMRSEKARNSKSAFLNCSSGIRACRCMHFPV